MNQNEKENVRKALQNDGEESIFRRFINLLFTKLMIIKSEELRRAKRVARMRVKRSAYKVSVRTPGGKRESGNPVHTGENSIKIDLP